MPSSVTSHTIPSFYACYFLRSYAGQGRVFGKTYIGSTPDPKRRKRQHNGELTAGAKKTSRGRPWEMEMIVYGFPSKIAALQFEWSWQKPHITRHLRVLPSEAARQGVAQKAGEMLLPNATSRRSRNGKTMKVSLNDPRSKFIALRALLASEPFALWGLKVVFFAEWAWEAWKALDNVGEGSSSGAFKFGGQSRGGVNLPPIHVSPAPTCCWKGVDGVRVGQYDKLPPEQDAASDASEKAAKKPRAKKASSQEDGSHSGLAWTEPSFVPSNALNSNISLSRQDLQGAPVEQHAMTAGETATSAWFNCSDDKLSEYQWARFESYLREQRIFSIEDLVKNQNVAKCSCCGGPINLNDQTSFSLCASTCRPLHPSPPLPARSTNRDHHCNGIYHVECLADTFAAASNSELQDDAPLIKQIEPTVLPVTGSCPGCGPSAPMGSWSEVIRGVFRRDEKYRDTLVAIAKEEAASEKRRQKEAERQALQAEKKAQREEAKRLRQEEKAAQSAVAKQAKKGKSAKKPAALSDTSSGDDDLVRTGSNHDAISDSIKGIQALLPSIYRPARPNASKAKAAQGVEGDKAASRDFAQHDVIDLVSPDVSLSMS